MIGILASRHGRVDGGESSGWRTQALLSGIRLSRAALFAQEALAATASDSILPQATPTPSVDALVAAKYGSDRPKHT